MESTPHLRDHTYLKTWPDFDNGRQLLEPRDYEHTDGRHHLVFSPRAADNEPRAQSTSSGDITRIGYRVWDERVQFLGMSIGPSHRGKKLGIELLKYFIGESPNQEGEVTGTGKIHKPLIAMSLLRLGFEPESTDYRVEILPRSTYDEKPRVPKVHVVNKSPSCVDPPDRHSSNVFYEVVDPEDVIRYYPLGTPEMVVALNTTYINPDAHWQGSPRG